MELDSTCQISSQKEMPEDGLNIVSKDTTSNGINVSAWNGFMMGKPVSLLPVDLFLPGIYHKPLQQKKQLVRELRARLCTIFQRLSPEVESHTVGGEVFVPLTASSSCAGTEDSGRSFGDTWLVYERFDKNERLLRDWLALPQATVAWGISDTVDIACNLSSALAELHKKDLVHGCVNPVSLVVKRSHRRCKARLLFTGVAEMLLAHGKQLNGLELKVPLSEYTPPERKKQPSQSLHESEDIFAFGVLMLQLCLGGRVQNGVRHDLPAEHLFHKIVYACLESQPEHRPKALLLHKQCRALRSSDAYVYRCVPDLTQHVQNLTCQLASLKQSQMELQDAMEEYELALDEAREEHNYLRKLVQSVLKDEERRTATSLCNEAPRGLSTVQPASKSCSIRLSTSKSCPAPEPAFDSHPTPTSTLEKCLTASPTSDNHPTPVPTLESCWKGLSISESCPILEPASEGCSSLMPTSESCSAGLSIFENCPAAEPASNSQPTPTSTLEKCLTASHTTESNPTPTSTLEQCLTALPTSDSHSTLTSTLEKCLTASPTSDSHPTPVPTLESCWKSFSITESCPVPGLASEGCSTPTPTLESYSTGLSISESCPAPEPASESRLVPAAISESFPRGSPTSESCPRPTPTLEICSTSLSSSKSCSALKYVSGSHPICTPMSENCSESTLISESCPTPEPASESHLALTLTPPSESSSVPTRPSQPAFESSLAGWAISEGCLTSRPGTNWVLANPHTCTQKQGSVLSPKQVAGDLLNTAILTEKQQDAQEGGNVCRTLVATQGLSTTDAESCLLDTGTDQITRCLQPKCPDNERKSLDHDRNDVNSTTTPDNHKSMTANGKNQDSKQSVSRSRWHRVGSFQNPLDYRRLLPSSSVFGDNWWLKMQKKRQESHKQKDQRMPDQCSAVGSVEDSIGQSDGHSCNSSERRCLDKHCVALDKADHSSHSKSSILANVIAGEVKTEDVKEDQSSDPSIVEANQGRSIRKWLTQAKRKGIKDDSWWRQKED